MKRPISSKAQDQPSCYNGITASCRLTSVCSLPQRCPTLPSRRRPPSALRQRGNQRGPGPKPTGWLVWRKPGTCSLPRPRLFEELSAKVRLQLLLQLAHRLDAHPDAAQRVDPTQEVLLLGPQL